MEYFHLSSTGQTFSKTLVQGTGVTATNLVTNNSYASLGQRLGPYPANLAPDFALKFNSLGEVNAWVASERPLKETITDSTYPCYESEQKSWVQAIMSAFHNMQNVIDGEKVLKQWQTMVAEDSVNVELVAWKLLTRVMLYHNLKGTLEPDNIETQKFASWNSFAEHMNYILNELGNKKTLCRHLCQDEFTSVFVDAPQMHAKRVVANRRTNQAKKLKNNAGSQALQNLQQLEETGTAETSQQSRLMEWNGTTSDGNSKSRFGLEETCTPIRTGATTARKSQPQSKQAPKSKVSRKRKSSVLDNDDAEIHCDESNTPEAFHSEPADSYTQTFLLSSPPALTRTMDRSYSPDSEAETAGPPTPYFVRRSTPRINMSPLSSPWSSGATMPYAGLYSAPPTPSFLRSPDRVVNRYHAPTQDFDTRHIDPRLYFNHSP